MSSGHINNNMSLIKESHEMHELDEGWGGL